MLFSSYKNTLITNKKELLVLVFILLFISLLSILHEYYKYKQFTSIEIVNTNANVLNIYPQDKFITLKLQTNEYTFFTKIKQKINIKKLKQINLYILTTNISFLDFLKGFYTKSFNIKTLNQKDNLKQIISHNISKQHTNKEIKELFNALFLAIPVSSVLREKVVDFGVSHLIALSGYHLGVLSFVLYWLLYLLYSPLHQKYLPYRNIKFDLLLATSIFLLIYVIFLSLVPSLLRALVMSFIALFLYRNNLKIFSFYTLLLIALIIFSFFPKLIFSLSLWLSIIGVFYIFLFIQYFSSLNKIIQFIIFNIWIYLALNPIIYQLFSIGSINQIYSIAFSICFTFFYPIELFLHLINHGDLFDKIIVYWLNLDLKLFTVTTSVYFTIYYLILSILSIYNKYSFIALNISSVIFSIFIFYF